MALLDFGRRLAVSGFSVAVSLNDDACGQDVLARAAVALVFAVPGARALVPFRLQTDTMFDVRALDIGFRADRVPFANLLDDADPFLQDELAGPTVASTVSTWSARILDHFFRGGA